ncbi:MAG: hypothetical protein IPO40_24905 [Fibrobacteres bacterium]|nr:hypothetical protein [Fibrobacterota bacterium]
MSDRTFFVRLNLDDMSAEVVGLDSTDERGQWLEGFLVGSRGKDSRDVWHPAKLDGHRFGMVCFQEAENYRGKQSAKGVASGEARRNRTAVEPLLNNGLTAVEPDGNRTPTGPQPIQHPTSNIQKLRSQQPAATGQAGIPCSEFSPTQEHQDICAFRGASFEHQLARFRDLNKSANDTAQGWEHRFRSFCGKSRPEVNQAPISPPAPRQEQKRPTWTIERDIRDEEGRLKTAQGERKEARDQRNRFSMGQSEFTRHDAEMRKADAKITASETRLVELRNEMEASK